MPSDGIDTPQKFLHAISKQPRRDLQADSSVVEAVGEDWKAFFTMKSQSFEERGVGAKERKYILWAMERFRQGYNPYNIAYNPKPKKVVRGCVF